MAGSCFAETGPRVTCVDPDRNRVRLLSSGVVPDPEPGLAEPVALNVTGGRLRFSSGLRAGIRSGAVPFIATGTERGAGAQGRSDPADLAKVLKVARAIGRHMTEEKVVLTLSPLPVGSARQIRAVIEE